MVESERVTLEFRDTDGIVWNLVVAENDPTLRTVASGERVDHTSWWHDGTTYAQVTRDLPQNHDTDYDVDVRATGVRSGMRTDWHAAVVEAVRWPRTAMSLALRKTNDATYLRARGSVGEWTRAVTATLYDEAGNLLKQLTVYSSPLQGPGVGDTWLADILLEPGWGDQMLRVEATPWSAASIHGGAMGYKGPVDVKELQVAEVDIIPPARNLTSASAAWDSAGDDTCPLGTRQAGVDWETDVMLSTDYIEVTPRVDGAPGTTFNLGSNKGNVDTEFLSDGGDPDATFLSTRLADWFWETNWIADNTNGVATSVEFDIVLKDEGGTVLSTLRTAAITINKVVCSEPSLTLMAAHLGADPGIVRLTVDTDRDSVDYGYALSGYAEVTHGTTGNVTTETFANPEDSLNSPLPADIQDAVFTRDHSTRFRPSPGAHTVTAYYTMEIVRKSDGAVVASANAQDTWTHDAPVAE